MTLRRTGPLARRTPLANRTRLAPGTPLARSSELARTGPLPRTSRIRTHAEIRASRPTISREEKHARDVVKARSQWACEGCDRARAVHWSHRVAKGQGGPWCPANGLHLCAHCHLWLGHANPVEARSVGWLLRSTDDYLTFPVLLPVRGLVLLGTDGTFTPIERSA